MSMQEVREQNIALVTQTALACFVENGIEKTTIRDIAQHAGLTERSVYRYFAGKDELVIAAAYLYWDRAKELAAQSLAKQRRRGMTGIEEIRVLLRSYAGLIFTDPAGIRFSLDAEVALCNAGRQHAVINRPPERFEVAPGPIAAAIRRGLADGTVDPEADVKTLYYNTYDSILGVIQRRAERARAGRARAQRRAVRAVHARIRGAAQAIRGQGTPFKYHPTLKEETAWQKDRIFSSWPRRSALRA